MRQVKLPANPQAQQPVQPAPPPSPVGPPPNAMLPIPPVSQPQPQVQAPVSPPVDYNKMAEDLMSQHGIKVKDGKISYKGRKELGVQIASMAQLIYAQNMMNMPKIRAANATSAQAGTTPNLDMEGSWGKPSGGKKPQRRT